MLVETFKQMRAICSIALLSILLWPNFPVLAQQSELADTTRYRIEGIRYSDLADIAFENERYDSSNYYHERAFESLAKAQKWEIALDNLMSIAGNYYYTDDFELATQYNQRAEAFALQHFDTTNINFGYIRSLQGLIYDIKGRYREAIELLKASKKVFEANDASPSDLSINLQNLAQVQRRNGDYYEAIKNLEQALSLLEQAEEKELISEARIYIFLAYNHNLIKSFDSVIAYSKKALSVLKLVPNGQRKNQLIIDACLNMARSYRLKGQYGEAESVIKRALVIQEKGQSYQFYQSFFELGQLAFLKENYSKALTYFERSFEETQAFYPTKSQHPKLAKCKGQIAEVYFKKGALKESIDRYQEALRLIALDFEAQDFATNPPLSNLLSLREAFPIVKGKANALLAAFETNKDSDYLNASLATFERLSDLIDQARGAYLSWESKLFLVPNAHNPVAGTIKAAPALHDLSQDKKYLELALNFAERNKAILLRESLLENQALGLGNIPDTLLRKEERLSRDIAFYERRILLTRKTKDDGAQAKAWKEQLFDFRQQYQQLKLQLEQDYPDYYKLKYQPSQITIAAIQQSLPTEKGGMIEFFVG